MLRTFLILGRVAGARRRKLHVGLRGVRATKQHERIYKRLREDEAERAFMQKIREDRNRREKIIAKALRQALAKKEREESKLLRQYEANKVEAAEELRKLKEKQEAPPAVAAPQVQKPVRVPCAKKAELQREEIQQRRAKEREAEKAFFEMIEKLRKRRESEMLAEQEFEKQIRARMASVEKEESGLGGSDSPAVPSATDVTADTVTAQEVNFASNQTTELKEVAEQTEDNTLKEMEEHSELNVALEEPSRVASAKVSQEKQRPSIGKEKKKTLQTKQEQPKTREKRRKRIKVTDHVPATPQMTVENPADYVPSASDRVYPPVFQQPTHAVSLTGFNEPPVMSSMAQTPDFGQRHVQSLPSLESPVIPLRPRALDTFLPVARMARSMPVSFPHIIPAVRQARERPTSGAGLHRL
ncbi:hypothetical protein TCSYLVIO_004018 [Trypanosoma cruzi]|nr:hypothetical protein TCSYLVIO_004018 [Trypanosoma cruzi]